MFHARRRTVNQLAHPLTEHCTSVLITLMKFCSLESAQGPWMTRDNKFIPRRQKYEHIPAKHMFKGVLSNSIQSSPDRKQCPSVSEGTDELGWLHTWEYYTATKMKEPSHPTTKMWISQVKRSVKEARHREYVIDESVYTMRKNRQNYAARSQNHGHPWAGQDPERPGGDFRGGWLVLPLDVGARYTSWKIHSIVAWDLWAFLQVSYISTCHKCFLRVIDTNML